jgi:hypothetical protein
VNGYPGKLVTVDRQEFPCLFNEVDALSISPVSFDEDTVSSHVFPFFML